jgi:pimeloyl-ACP methyl ester carboxylesterase
LHYLQQGKGDTVVLLHGGMGDCWSWPRQMPLLARRFRVVSYSRRYNFPNTNRVAAGRYSCRIDASDLGDFLKKLGCVRAHLVGTSYGALTALQFALCRPEAVMSLVLVEPPVFAWLGKVEGGLPARRAFLHEVWRPAAAYFKQGESGQAMRCLYDGMRGAGRYDLTARGASHVLRNALAMEMLTGSRNPFPDLSLRAARKLKMPMLLVRGEETVRVHRLCHLAAGEVLVQAQHAIIARAGHAPANENSAAFNRTLKLFLSSACSAPRKWSQ